MIFLQCHLYQWHCRRLVAAVAIRQAELIRVITILTMLRRAAQHTLTLLTIVSRTLVEQKQIKGNIKDSDDKSTSNDTR